MNKDLDFFYSRKFELFLSLPLFKHLQNIVEYNDF
jgi:hypothetical protein